MEITTMIGCPLKCTFCPQTPLIKNYKNPNKFLTVENFETVLDKLPKEVRIDFSGMAEPWANPDCTDMLQLALEKGFNVAVYSTLYKMTEEDIDRVYDLTIKHQSQIMKFVMHMPDAHNNMRGWKYSETWERAFKKFYNMSSEIKNSPARGVDTMTMDMNAKRFHEDMMHIPEAHHAQSDGKGFTTFAAHDRAGVLDTKQVERQGDQDIKQIRIAKHERPLTCKSTPFYDRNVLLPNGDIVLCCMDYALKHIIGNLLEQTYEEMFQNPQFLDLVKMNETPGFDKCSICKSCTNITYIKT
jgi:organic radical activating enzyme